MRAVSAKELGQNIERLEGNVPHLICNFGRQNATKISDHYYTDTA
jgi:hypothetical protein